MDNKEIERKFLVDINNIPNIEDRSYLDITQGYIKHIGGEYIYRLRQILFAESSGLVRGDKYYQTIKGSGHKVRDEFEIELFKDQFRSLWVLCEKESIHKYRYILTDLDVKNDGIKKKEVALDIYKNDLSGLITVEVEFFNEEDCNSYIPESWFGEEVSENWRYGNFNLSIYGKPM